MEYLYIDESGTMTVSHNKTHPYFIISIIRAKNIAKNCIIQIADVFSNLYFSQLKAYAYTNEIEQMKKDGYLKQIFEFPPKQHICT